MEKTLEKGEIFGGKSDRTRLKNDEYLEEKRTKMRPIAELAAIRMMVPCMEFM